MKIIVSSTGVGLDASVDPRFGRCAYFVTVDTDSGAVKATANPFLEAAGGAGTQAAQWVLEQGAEVLMTGRCGPKAAAVLADADICVIENVFGSVGAVTASLQGASAPAKVGVGPGDSRDGGLCRGIGGWRGPGGGRRRRSGRGLGSAGRY